MKVTWRSSLEVAGGAMVEFSFSGSCAMEGRDIWNFKVKAGGTIKVGFKGYYRVDVLWWEKADTISYYPESCVTTLPTWEFKPLALLKG